MSNLVIAELATQPTTVIAVLEKKKVRKKPPGFNLVVSDNSQECCHQVCIELRVKTKGLVGPDLPSPSYLGIGRASVIGHNLKKKKIRKTEDRKRWLRFQA